jgi:uncharacterized membrane protein
VENLLHLIAHGVALAVETIAIAVIAIGAIEAVIDIVRLLARRDATNDDRRAVWLRFARWLVAGLTFQLAADVVNTSFDPSWDELGRLAAIAAIRTFLSFFLDREVDDTRRLQHRLAAAAAAVESDNGERR